MNVNPQVGAWVSFIALVLAGVGAGSIEFGGLSTAVVSTIKTAAGDGLFLITCANLVFHLYSAPTPGPLAKN